MWVPITLAAATFQILRTSQQHRLRDTLSTAAATYVRFVYGAPLAIAAALVVFGVVGRPLPTVPLSFWLVITIAGVAQIVGTVALLASFKVRDFAVGTVYSKGEVLIVAALGGLGVGSALAAWGWVGALLVTIGVVVLASEGDVRALAQRAGDPAALLGIAAGGLFGIAAIGIGDAADRLGNAPTFDRAVVALTALLVVQAALNTLWFVVINPHELVAVARAWRPSILIGALSMVGSLSWAWAFTLTGAAKVRTLGQVELVIAFAIAHFVLRERHTRIEYVASGLVLLGAVIVAAVG
ncbi:MAG: EamA family transporter [Actinomycetota bacterium]